MKRLTVLTFLLAAVPALFAQPGFIQLFNGKDFTGWKISGAQETFTIKDGAMVANGPVAHAFYDGPVSKHDFKDFELMVDVMTQPNSNGGVYFHTEFQEKGFPRKGFEVQVNNTHTDPIKSGSLYHVKDIGKDVIEGITKDNEWFTEHIIVKGNNIVVKLNGKEVVNWTQTADWNGGREGPGRVIGRGTIAFQGHDPKSTVYYKNVRIKPL
jgi:3-keto-disaccharide hydrolase